MLFMVSSFTINNLVSNIHKTYFYEELYPVEATAFIKNNLDYKNIRIYNSYNTGSYLMFNDIPNFIDSRLDVYCSEFNNTDIFYDYVQLLTSNEHYENIFKKYNFSHILLENSSYFMPYISIDPNYKLLYEDENFSLFERLTYDK